MSKVMFVTVGTSLFHSASWEPDALSEIPQYREWTVSERSRNTLCSPEARKRTPNARQIQTRLEEALCAGDYDLWAQRLARDLLAGSPYMDTVMRYSAELATILKTWRQTPDVSLADFLRSYASIQIAADPTSGLPFQAARHLAHTLNFLAGGSQSARVDPVYGLSSTKPDELLGNNSGLGLLGRLILEELNQVAQLDLVVSGGYKLYGITFASLLRIPDKRVRLLYIHEEGDHLVQIPRTLKDRASEARLDPAQYEEYLRRIGDVGLLS